MLTQIWSACTDNFFSFQAIVCSFAPLLIPKIKIWKKCKTKPGDIILLQMCTINQDHMMYGSWDMKFNRHNVFVIVCIFLPFYLPPSFKQPQKKNIWKKWKKHLEISSFYTTVPKIMIICYTVPEIWCVMDVIAIFHFGLCFSFLPPTFNNPKNEKFKTIKRKPWGIILRKCTKNNDHMLYCSWDIACVECNSFFHLGQFLALFPN